MQQVNLVLHAIEGPFVAFSIDFSLYFMRVFPVPQIFNDSLVPQLIPNLDFWFQAQTHQRYSYRGFMDMVEAFRAGLEKSYSINDLKMLAVRTVTATKNELMKQMPKYAKSFWIEVLDPAKLESVWTGKVREQFETLRTKLGDDGFYNNLCRLWKFAINHRPGLVSVFEKLISRLDRVPSEPVYPETTDLDNELYKTVLSLVLDKTVSSFKGTPPDVQTRLEMLNGK